MMTKLTMPNTATVNQGSRYARQTARTGATASKEAEFAKIVDKKMDNQAVGKSYSSRNNQEAGVQAKYAYDNVDPAKMEQLSQDANDPVKDEPHGDSRPANEDFLTTEEMEQIAMMTTTMRKLADNSETLDEQTKVEAISGAFGEILDSIGEGAKSIDKLKELLAQLQQGSLPDNVTQEDGTKLVELLSTLMNELLAEGGVDAQDKLGTSDGNSSMQAMAKLITSKSDQVFGKETQDKSETVTEIGKQLIAQLDILLGKHKGNAVGTDDDNRSLQALLQLVISKTNQLIGQETESSTKSINKEDFSVKLRDIIETVLAAAQKDNDGEGLKNTVDALVAQLFATGVDNDNKATINGILQKYGLLSAKGGNSTNKLELDELKSRIASALLLMTEKAGGEKSEKHNSIDMYDRFSDILKESIKSKGLDQQEWKTPAKANIDEDKLLSKILGKEGNDTDSKTAKINNLIQQLNNSKNDIAAEKVTEKPVITKGNFNQDIIRTVRYMSLNNLKELTVKIMPKDLGEITIVLTTSGENMKASITANTKDAFSLLSSNVGEIRNALDNNTIRIQDVKINIYQEDASFNSNNANAGRQGKDSSGNTRGGNRNGQEEALEGNDSIARDDSNISILI